jgi:hypothetical protein
VFGRACAVDMCHCVKLFGALCLCISLIFCSYFFTLGDLLHLPFVVPVPSDLGATTVVAPGQMPGCFYLPLAQIACLFSKASTVISARLSAVGQSPTQS